jgi:Glycosyl transferase 4-like domain
MDCRVLTTGTLDPERETSLDEVLATLELHAGRFQADLGTGKAAEVVDLGVNGVRVTVTPTASSRAERSPDTREAAIFLDLADQVLDRFRPDVLLTYGGHPASLELMRWARQWGIAVVFHLHHFGYSEPKGSDSKNDRRAFAEVATVIFPSESYRRYLARLLGLDGPIIPDPIALDRIVIDNPKPQYVTSVNSQLPNAFAVFARIAIELNRKQPNTPPKIWMVWKSTRILGFRKPDLTPRSP